MASLEDQLQSILQEVTNRERVARRRAAIYSTVPIVVAGVLILIIGWRIQLADQELALTDEHLQGTQQELASVNIQLAKAEEQVKLSQEVLALTEAELKQANQEVSALKEEAERYRQEAEKHRKEAEQYREEIEELRQQLDELNTTLTEVTEKLHQAIDFQRELAPVDVFRDIKSIARLYPPTQAGILFEIVQQYAGVDWKLGGTSPWDGFDSPSFVAYVLDDHGLLPVPVSEARYRLRDILPARDGPRVGDIVFYELGYTMFYYEGEGQQPFVIGMTPLGILALKPDFAAIVGYGEVSYPPP